MTNIRKMLYLFILSWWLTISWFQSKLQCDFNKRPLKIDFIRSKNRFTCKTVWKIPELISKWEIKPVSQSGGLLVCRSWNQASQSVCQSACRWHINPVIRSQICLSLCVCVPCCRCRMFCSDCDPPHISCCTRRTPSYKYYADFLKENTAFFSGITLQYGKCGVHLPPSRNSFQTELWLFPRRAECMLE